MAQDTTAGPGCVHVTGADRSVGNPAAGDAFAQSSTLYGPVTDVVPWLGHYAHLYVSASALIFVSRYV